MGNKVNVLSIRSKKWPIWSLVSYNKIDHIDIILKELKFKQFLQDFFFLRNISISNIYINLSIDKKRINIFCTMYPLSFNIQKKKSLKYYISYNKKYKFFLFWYNSNVLGYKQQNNFKKTIRLLDNLLIKTIKSTLNKNNNYCTKKYIINFKLNKKKNRSIIYINNYRFKYNYLFIKNFILFKNYINYFKLIFINNIKFNYNKINLLYNFKSNNKFVLLNNSNYFCKNKLIFFLKLFNKFKYNNYTYKIIKNTNTLPKIILNNLKKNIKNIFYSDSIIFNVSNLFIYKLNKNNRLLKKIKLVNNYNHFLYNNKIKLKKQFNFFNKINRIEKYLLYLNPKFYYLLFIKYNIYYINKILKKLFTISNIHWNFILNNKKTLGSKDILNILKKKLKKLKNQKKLYNPLKLVNTQINYNYKLDLLFFSNKPVNLNFYEYNYKLDKMQKEYKYYTIKNYIFFLLNVLKFNDNLTNSIYNLLINRLSNYKLVNNLFLLKNKPFYIYYINNLNFKSNLLFYKNTLYNYIQNVNVFLQSKLNFIFNQIKFKNLNYTVIGYKILGSGRLGFSSKSTRKSKTIYKRGKTSLMNLSTFIDYENDISIIRNGVYGIKIYKFYRSYHKSISNNLNYYF